MSLLYYKPSVKLGPAHTIRPTKVVSEFLFFTGTFHGSLHRNLLAPDRVNPNLSFAHTIHIRYIQVSLNKRLIHFKALLWESIILLLPPPAAKPTLLQHYCTTIAQYTPPPPSPPSLAILYAILVMAISCKGQHTSSAQTHTAAQSCIYIYAYRYRYRYRYR